MRQALLAFLTTLGVGSALANELPDPLIKTARQPLTFEERVAAILARHGITHTIDWSAGAAPYLSAPGALRTAVCESIAEISGASPELATAGGTSDGRFFAAAGAQVVELGPVGATIHQIDERVALDSIEPLKNIYRRTLETLLT